MQHAPAIHALTTAAPSFNLANVRPSAVIGYLTRALVAAHTQPAAPTARAEKEFINARRHLLRHASAEQQTIPINRNV